MRSNDQAHLPGPLQELDDARNRNAAPVRCSAWFGGNLARCLVGDLNSMYTDLEIETFQVGFSQVLEQQTLSYA